MHAKPDLRVFLEWMIAGSGSVITDVMRLHHRLMQYRLSTLLLVVTLAAFAIYFYLPKPALRIETIHSATPLDEIQPLAYTISVQDRKFDSNHPTSFDPDDLYGNHFSDVLVTRDPSGKIWRELIVNIGSNDKRDIRVPAVLLDSIPQFEELLTCHNIKQLDSIFERSTRGIVDQASHDCWLSTQYWGGFTVEEGELRCVLVTAGISKASEGGEWEIFSRDISDGVYLPNK